MLDLFRAIIPSTHGEEVANIPRTAAVLHNDCVFLAHRCLTLGLEYKDKFPLAKGADDTRGKLLRQTCMFVDMVPPFRELADRSMGDMLEKQKAQLLEVVGSRITLLGDSLRSNESLVEWSEAETAIKAGLYHLRHLSQAWKPTLSREVYGRSMGYLGDTLFTMFSDQVMKAAAISESACQLVSALFRSAMQGVSELLDQDTLFCRCWDRFSAVGRFMDMSLADIQAALAEGVFRTVTGPELSRLIVATFSESEKRDHLLQVLAAHK
jgi:centromere/kinetochore protein ZW10